MINQYLLVPAANFRERGVSIPSISEADIADLVIRSASETLDELGIRHSRYWDHVDVQPGDLAIDFGVGYYTTKRTTNESSVAFGAGGDLAELLSETLSEWGRCCSFGHRVSRPIEDYKPQRIKLSLFAVNGPDAEQYLCRLTDLGRQIAATIADWHKNGKGVVKTPLVECNLP